MPQEMRHQVRACTGAGCGLRFPVLEHTGADLPCPRCGSTTKAAGDAYPEHKPARMNGRVGLPPMEALLDNIRSIYNVGSIFRTADGAGISRLHLCGITPTPDNPRLRKTALGADEAIAWTHHLNGCAAAADLKAQGLRLWALEGGDRSEPIHEFAPEIDGRPIVLVAGNEVSGVDPGILDQCEKILSIPMQGVKTSLNTAVAFGTAVYILRLRFFC